MKTTKTTTLLCTITLLLLYITSGAQGYGEIRGLIKNTELEVIPFATVKVLQGSLFISGALADINGKYSCKPLNPGSYEIVVMEPGHITQQINKIAVVPNEATYVDVKLNAHTFGTVTVIAKPIDFSQSGAETKMFGKVSLNAEELMQNASYNRGDVKGALEAVSSEVIATPDGEVHFRGGRSDAVAYFVDGVRTLGPTTVPGLSIDNLTVFSGGVPAMYGDITGGVVLITTKSYFSGIRDKNVRIASYNEKKEEEKAALKAKQDEENRAKEIKEEKEKNKLNVR